MSRPEPGWLGTLGRWLLRTAVLLVLLVCVASFWVGLRYRNRVVSAAEAPAAPFALVFGAGLWRGEPSDVLAERIDQAVALYRAGKVKKLLVTGDNWDPRHVETQAMRRYAEAAGVPAEDVIEDIAGLSTYDSCHRAQSVFGIEKALLVTQQFHLPRALYIANRLGIDAWGVAADEAVSTDRWAEEYAVREFFSRALAAGMVVLRMKPKVEGPVELRARKSPHSAPSGMTGGR